MDSIWISRGQVRLEDAVVSQATNKRLLADNENTDSTNKSSVDLIKKKIKTFLIFFFLRYDVHIDNFDVSYGNK